MNEFDPALLRPELETIDAPLEPRGSGDLTRILRHVADRSGHDLSPYRLGPILRRLECRVRESRLGSLADYAWLLRRTPAELDTLLPCLLGRVRRFFRAPAQLAALRTMVLEPLVSRRRAHEALKVWVVGCSTGEEAYSIAMLLLEVLDVAPASGLAIFATDVEPESIEVAHRGLYGPRIARSVSAERLERFFVREATGYRVNDRVRERIEFSTLDPLSDPSFSDLDLIVCRDLVDALKPAPRRMFLSRLRDGLKPGGSLLLGPAERRTVPAASFAALEARQRLFVRTPGEIETDGGQLGSRSTPPEALNTFVEATAHKAEEELVRSREFLASVSHELRTPLQAIVGYVDILSEEDSASRPQMLAALRRSANGLLDLVGAVLDLSRLEHAALPAPLERIVVSAFLKEIVDEIAAGSGRAEVQIGVHLAPEMPDLLSEPLAIKIALRNLIGNAVKYGGDTVRVSAGPFEGGCEFSISDRGPGIPLAEQQEVFEAFRRGRAARKSSDGVGLGLYVTRRLIESLGGSIALESRPGGGSTFRLRVPSGAEASRGPQPAGNAA